MGAFSSFISTRPGILPEASPCDEIEWLRKHRPELVRAGPQPYNQIAPTFDEELARALARPRDQPLDESEARRLAAAFQAHADLFRPVLLKLLADTLAEAITDAVVAAFTSLPPSSHLQEKRAS
jgi:hypothetical protein